MVDVGTFGGDFSEAKDVNNLGQVVGSARYADNTSGAFIYENGTLFDLNALVEAGTGWQLTDATGINDRGQIVGTGITADGYEHAFLLTPNTVPVPAAVWLFTSGLVGLLGFARVKSK